MKINLIEHITTITTGMREFVGWVESVTGTVDLNVIGSF